MTRVVSDYWSRPKEGDGLASIARMPTVGKKINPNAGPPTDKGERLLVTEADRKREEDGQQRGGCPWRRPIALPIVEIDGPR